MTVTGYARQVYADLVRARSRVRLLPAQEVDLTSPPIFVVGVYRSGTTLLRYALDSHPRIACPPETDCLDLLGAALDDPPAMLGLDSMGFDRAHVTRQIRGMCSYFYSNYAASCGKARWADKTPSYVDHLDLVNEIFPHAQYLVIHRHPLDQISSHTKGGAFVHPPLAALTATYGDVRIAAAHYWVDQTRKILAFGSVNPPACALTYEDLCAEPRRVLGTLLSAIGEEWSDQVLDFHAHPHDQGHEAASIQRTRGFNRRTHDYRSWDREVLETCVDVVRDTAEVLGYQVRP